MGKGCLHFFSAVLDRIFFILAGNDNMGGTKHHKTPQTTTNHTTKHHKPTQTTTNQTTKPLKPKLIVGYTSSDPNWGRKCAGGPNFCILEKKFFFTFFISSDVKNCQILNQKNIAISAFLQCKIIQFLLFFFLRSKYVSD